MKIALIGEAYGEHEEYARKPFVGPAGKELDRILQDAGIAREECLTTNVFNFRPPGSDVLALCGPKSSPLVAAHLPPLAAGKYLLTEHLGELARVRAEVAAANPNVAVLLGNSASWAFLGTAGIAKIRGACALSPFVPGLKCLPTYHPAAVLRQYDLRHVTVSDMMKAKRQGEFPELRRPARELWLEPNLQDIRDFLEAYLRPATHIAVDVETDRDKQITCIGFAPATDRALCIPFKDQRKPKGNYWETLKEELDAWALVQEILLLPAKKIGQNFLYDISYIWQVYGLRIHNYTDDTMLMHHALQPELPKGLGFMGSVYTDEVSWKADRARGEDATIKRED